MAELIARVTARYNDPEVAERVAKQEAEREAEEQAERAAESAYRERARRSAMLERGIPAKDLARILDGGLQETAALDEARRFLATPAARLLVLSGTRGCGKTTAAAWITAQSCPDPCRREEDRGEYRPARYQDLDVGKWPWPLAPRFVDVSRLARLSRYEDATMRPLEECSMLAIDDLGMEYADAKGFFTSLLDGLINARYAADLRTVITTNLLATDFKARYEEPSNRMA